uniref:proline-rich receptor-like protein kinase PERK2 n=1 Tax=Ictidomys tridecemlineatus TaxID=43179 RepID=UPI000B5409E0
RSKRKKWKTLCASEWPTFNTSWPPEETFNIDSILQVKSRIFIQGPQGHPDQIPYIITWGDLASKPPSWVAPFSPPKSPSHSSPLEPSAPLLPVPPPPPPLPPQTSQLYPVLDKSETSTKPGATPKKVLPPEDSALIDLLSDEPPPYQPQPLPTLGSNPPSSEEEKNNQEGPTTSAPPDPSPMAGRLRGRRDHTAPGDTSKVLPLRQTGGPNSQY